MFRALALVLLVLLALHDVSSFRPRSMVRSNSSPTARKAEQRPVTNKGSYEQLLAQAKQQKLAKQGVSSVEAGQARPQKQQQQRPQQQSAPISSASASQVGAGALPFSDDLYAHLKFMIEKLSQRMKTEQALSPSDLQRFQRAVDAVIKDARENGGSTSTRKESSSSSSTSSSSSAAAVLVSKSASSSSSSSSSSSPPRAAVTAAATTSSSSNSYNRKSHTQQPAEGNDDSTIQVYGAGEGPRNSDKPDPNSPFSSLHGLTNTWQIQGMENMTTEQYYAAINKRISSMKEKRKEIGSYQYDVTANYEQQLNRQNRTGLKPEK